MSPVFTAPNRTSAASARICSRTHPRGTGRTAATRPDPWAVSAPRTASASPPAARAARRSARIPAPPEGSSPPTQSSGRRSARNGLPRPPALNRAFSRRGGRPSASTTLPAVPGKDASRAALTGRSHPSERGREARGRPRARVRPARDRPPRGSTEIAATPASFAPRRTPDSRGRDPPERQHGDGGCLARPDQRLHAGRRTIGGLGRGFEHRAERRVVGARPARRAQLLERMGRGADPQPPTGHPSRLGDGDRGHAEMDAVRARGERHIDPVVHDDPHPERLHRATASRASAKSGPPGKSFSRIIRSVSPASAAAGRKGQNSSRGAPGDR